MAVIKSGNSGEVATVNAKKRLLVDGIETTAEVQAVTDGDAYNINTGVIGLTSSSDSAVLYVKNNESRNLIISTLVLWAGDTGTITDDAICTVIRNPTAGTIVSGATAVDMNQNRNFGSSNTLTVDAYKGAEANTFTDGEDIALVGFGGRAPVPINIELQKGNSIGINIDPNTSSGTTNVYVALICYLEAE